VHCVQGTWGAQLHPELVVAGEVVRKGEHGEDGYSGFSMRDPGSGEVVPTRLAALLRAAGAEQLVVVGLATDYCVRATALEGREQGWAVTVPWSGWRPSTSVRATASAPGWSCRTRA
jgi:nicotinamidase/pyrazinamidase